MKQLLTTTLAAMLLAGCASAPQSSSPAASAEATAPRLAPINEMFAEYWEANLEHNPVTATYIGDPRYNDRLPDTGTAAWRARNPPSTSTGWAAPKPTMPMPCPCRTRSACRYSCASVANRWQVTAFPAT